VLRGGPRWKGVYNPAVYYQQSDTVSYAGSGWLYINPNPAAGETPSESNPVYWQLLSRKGDPGGTGGNDVAYDPIGWNGATWTPSANVLRDVIELLARANNAVLTGNPTAPTQPVGNNSDRLASTAFVIAEIVSRLTSPNLLGVPLCPTPLLPDNSGAIANTNFVKAVMHRYSRIIDSKTTGTPGGSAIAGVQIRALNTIPNNAGDIVALAANRFTLRPGTYRILACAPTGNGVGGNRIYLRNITSSTTVLSGQTSGGTTLQNLAWLRGTFSISVNSDFEIWHFCQFLAAGTGLGGSVGDGSPEIFTDVEIWRID
jgi:hypothetical protein